MDAAPIARVMRSGRVESLHHGMAVVLEADGHVLLSLGDTDAPMYPRSVLKPVQAVAMLREGLDLTGRLLALAAASHSGERFHLDGVLRILQACGLDESALQNTPDLPLDTAERTQWLRLGRRPSSLAQNCSGKHAAMIATCVTNGWDVDLYREPDHPLELAIRSGVADLARERVAHTGVDGCGAPLYAVSLKGLARAFSTLGTAGNDRPSQRAVADALRSFPEWVGGTGRLVTDLMRGLPGLVAKEGAEAVCAASMPDGRALAVKIADGSTRALWPVVAELLRHLGLDAEVLDRLADQPVLGHGVPVGGIEVTLGTE